MPHNHAEVEERIDQSNIELAAYYERCRIQDEALAEAVRVTALRREARLHASDDETQP